MDATTAGILSLVVGSAAGPALVDAMAAGDERSKIPILGKLGVAKAHEDYDAIAGVAIGLVAYLILRRYF